MVGSVVAQALDEEPIGDESLGDEEPADLSQLDESSRAHLKEVAPLTAAWLGIP